MFSDRTLINRRNITQDPHSNYRADRDFFLLILKSRVIAAAMKVLGLEGRESQPTIFHIPDDISSYSKLQTLEILHKAAVSESDINGMIDQVITAQER